MLLDPSHEMAAQLKILLDKVDIDLVEWGTSGTEWIAPFQKRKPNFLIVEYLLPKRDGIHCIHKAMELIPACKAVLMHTYSGLAANELELKALSVGAAAVIQKPLVEMRFQAILRRLDELVRQADQKKARTSSLA